MTRRSGRAGRLITSFLARSHRAASHGPAGIRLLCSVLKVRVLGCLRRPRRAHPEHTAPSPGPASAQSLLAPPQARSMSMADAERSGQRPGSYPQTPTGVARIAADHAWVLRNVSGVPGPTSTRHPSPSRGNLQLGDLHQRSAGTKFSADDGAYFDKAIGARPPAVARERPS
jgi:hypothetical protein